MADYVSLSEFARRMDVAKSTVSDAIAVGRIKWTTLENGKKKIDWDTESINFDKNRTRANPPKSRRDKKKNVLERHIGDTEVYEMGNMGIDSSNSQYNNIPDVDNISAEPGSVAYFQARKIAIDGTRSLLALRQEAGELISVPDAMGLYCESLSEMSQAIQEIPSKVTNVICATIRKEVSEWKRPPENLEAEIFRIITTKIKTILTDLSNKIEQAQDTTQEYIDSNVVRKSKKKPRKK